MFALFFMGGGYHTSYFHWLTTSTLICIVVKSITISLRNTRRSYICHLMLFSLWCSWRVYNLSHMEQFYSPLIKDFVVMGSRSLFMLSICSSNLLKQALMPSSSRCVIKKAFWCSFRYVKAKDDLGSKIIKVENIVILQVMVSCTYKSMKCY